MSAQNPNLTLDERAFQDLLSAAFTIQEHNDRQKWAHQSNASAAISVCPHCGAKKLSNASPCSVCGQEEFRPGERLQRNWASMWLHSQDHLSGLTPDGGSVHPKRISSDLDDDVTAEIPATAKALGRALPPLQQSVRDDSLLNQRKAETRDGNIPDANLVEAIHSSSLRPPSNFPAIESSAPTHIQSDPDSAINSAVNSAINPALSPDLDPEFNSGMDLISRSTPRPDSVFQRLSEWRVRLRFQRADVFLGLAVFVSAAALLWPAAVPPRPGALDPWERALVMLGIAEPPEPLIHLQGDPGVNVWIDPHSALYYCPGEDQYGKTTDGRLSSQREAQMDRFEPASRTPCE